MDREVRQIGPRQNWDGAKHGVDDVTDIPLLEPPTTDLPLVPDDLLKVVRVNAKQTDTRGYACKMHGLECSACGE